MVTIDYFCQLYKVDKKVPICPARLRNHTVFSFQPGWWWYHAKPGAIQVAYALGFHTLIQQVADQAEFIFAGADGLKYGLGWLCRI